MNTTNEDRMDWKVTFLIGLGFFTTGISWALYNSYVPVWLNGFISDRWIVGLIMGLDNLAMMFMEPIVGTKSDKTRTRFGRRIPYLIIGIPISGLFLTMLPVFRNVDLFPLIAVIVGFLLMMAFYRAPTVALMPDMVPSKHRSKANGVINLMGGLGAVYAFLFASFLYAVEPIFAFGSTALIMLIALVLLVRYVQEPVVDPAIPNEEVMVQEVESHSVINSLREVFTNPERTGVFILLAIFFWFLAYNAIETWFTSWALETLPHLKNIELTDSVESAEAAASRMLTAFSLVFVLFAIPAGLLGQKIGRARTIKIGLPLMIGALFLAYFVGQFNGLGLGDSAQYFAVMGLLTIAGVSWALINVNSIVIVWEVGGNQKLGAYTGVYYLFSSSAAVIGPFFTGFLFDVLAGGRFELLFPVCLVFFTVAFVLMFGVKVGEAEPDIETHEYLAEIDI